jgi:hypothetical protein
MPFGCVFYFIYFFYKKINKAKGIVCQFVYNMYANNIRFNEIMLHATRRKNKSWFIMWIWSISFSYLHFSRSFIIIRFQYLHVNLVNTYILNIDIMIISYINIDIMIVSYDLKQKSIIIRFLELNHMI